MDPRKPLDIVVVGGSNAGLMVAILLRRQGHNVRVLEQAASDERQGLAAGIGFSQQTRQFFDTQDRLGHEPMGVMNEDVFVMDPGMNVLSKMRLNQMMTTWDKTYYRLRANFDGFKSSYCEDVPQAAEGERQGQGVFITGIKVLSVDGSSRDQMKLLTDDVRTGDSKMLTCDIVVAADGANSSIRRQLNPRLQREEPGYVIWRGTTPTTELARRTLDKIEGNTILFSGKYFYCIAYTIPGDHGTLAPGSQHINFACYMWPFAPISEIMTDVDGHQHRTTIPMGKLRPPIWAKQVETFRRLLPPELMDIVDHIRQPFVSVISSISSPRAAYMDDRLFLIGDALAQTQPNLGMGTSLAAFGAMSLASTIGSAGDGALLDAAKVQAWNDKVVAYTTLIRMRSAAFASWYLCSWPAIIFYYARFYLTKGLLWWHGKPSTISGVPMT